MHCVMRIGCLDSYMCINVELLQLIHQIECDINKILYLFNKKRNILLFFSFLWWGWLNNQWDGPNENLKKIIERHKFGISGLWNVTYGGVYWIFTLLYICACERTRVRIHIYIRICEVWSNIHLKYIHWI